MADKEGQGKRSLEARADAFSRLKNTFENMYNKIRGGWALSNFKVQA